jgi:hypothetical protein
MLRTLRSLASAVHTHTAPISVASLSSGLREPAHCPGLILGAARAMATAGKAQRDWRAPPGAADAGPTPLLLQNSFLDEKVPFVPAAGPDSKQITWYACGPTVYDVAHMGHARNYLTFDIIRRVLEDYFGYNLLMVMNVTDVDDKIILRARRNYLLAQYKDAGKPATEVRLRRSARQPRLTWPQAGFERPNPTPRCLQVRAYAEVAVQAAVAKQDKKIGELQGLVAAAVAEAEVRAAAPAEPVQLPHTLASDCGPFLLMIGA